MTSVGWTVGPSSRLVNIDFFAFSDVCVLLPLSVSLACYLVVPAGNDGVVGEEGEDIGSRVAWGGSYNWLIMA